MKNKDTQLLEEAYTKINEMHMPASGIGPETEKMYWAAFEKFSNDEITSQQWYDICAKLLGDLMEKNKDVRGPQKVKQKEENKDYFNYWKKREEAGTNF